MRSFSEIGEMSYESDECDDKDDVKSVLTITIICPKACSAERMLAIVHMRSLLNYSKHCCLEASAREQ
jgi:hypothetical protein